MSIALSWQGPSWAVRTLTVIGGVGVAVGGVLSAAPFFATASVIVGCVCVVFGHTLDQVCPVLKYAQVGVHHVGNPDMVGRAAMAIRLSYAQAQQKSYLPLPDLESLPGIGPLIPGEPVMQLEAYLAEALSGHLE